MTARQVYEAMLTELNKVEAPTLLLEDFNYFFNKEIQQYINTNYTTRYDLDLLGTDDLRVLKATAVLKPIKTKSYGEDNLTLTFNNLYGNVYEVELPNDYLHILSCICDYKVNKTFKCYDEGTHEQFAATRLTSDSWPTVFKNYYLKPSYRRPYYFIHNVNPVEADGYSKKEVPTNPYRETTTNNLGAGTDPTPTIEDRNGTKVVNLHGLSKKYSDLGGDTVKYDLVERLPGVRYGNHSTVRMEIRYGKDDSVFELDKVYIDYLKAPLNIRLTQEQIDKTEDTSQIMEFPDYVCLEIINGLVKLVLENGSDTARLQTHIAMNLSIATPGQLLTQQ